eukprot:TRINITY_DN2062_c1_g1_i1.p1 TRINITY_DN2062_c1_g1~~TRINITY_DN2062_c1_g1_i1.p1  ORF type:complete len:301 (-),score=91.37 TRINITY_DN2062_c1_g1_i1:42-944(-)
MDVQYLPNWNENGPQLLKEKYEERQEKHAKNTNEFSDLVEDYAHFVNLGTWEPQYPYDKEINEMISLYYGKREDIIADSISISFTPDRKLLNKSDNRGLDVVNLGQELNGMGDFNTSDVRGFKMKHSRNYEHLLCCCVPLRESLPLNDAANATKAAVGSVSALRVTYLNIFHYCVVHQVDTIVITPLAVKDAPTTTDPGYGLIPAANVALRTVRGWLENVANRVLVSKIVFLCESEREFLVYRDLMEKIFPPIPTEEQIEEAEVDDEMRDEMDDIFGDFELNETVNENANENVNEVDKEQ